MSARSGFDMDKYVAGVRLGGAIRALRKRRAMPLLELSRAIGIAASAMSDMESGRRGISAERIRQVAKVLGTTARRLCKLSGVCAHCVGSGVTGAAR